MKKESLPIAVLFLAVLFQTSCSGGGINAKHARNLIVDMPQVVFEKEDVEVVHVRQVTRTDAIAETRLKTAIRYERSTRNG